MTGGPHLLAGLPGLHVDLGQHSRPWTPDRGRWLRPPTADYRCPRCGAVESAVGEQVRAFAATIHRTHRAACPAAQKASGARLWPGGPRRT